MDSFSMYEAQYFWVWGLYWRCSQRRRAGGLPHFLLQCELLQTGWKKSLSVWLANPAVRYSQSDVLKKHLYFISCCKLLSATQLFSCKHIPEIGKTQAVDYQLKHSEFLMKSLPACPLWVSACSITSAWCYREQRLLLAAACAVTAGSAACAQPPSAVPEIYAVLIVPGHSQMLSGFLFCKCARKENICLQVKSLRNLL